MEKLLYYVWEHRLFDSQNLFTTKGEKIEIIDPGHRNSDSGPDFFNAKIRIGEKLWAGNVEIHKNASDWKHHNHDHDKSYDSVILHVIENDDTEIVRSTGEIIPQFIIRYPDIIKDNYELLIRQDSFLPCGDRLHELPVLFLTDWITSLAMERLQEKARRICNWLESYRGNWEEVCFITLSRSLGFGTNSDAFERLARSLPLLFMQKHADSLFQVEAFLFGQAGLLDPEYFPNDAYYQRMANEYAFLKNKFGLSPLNPECWKFARLRPANFPHQRIALLAQLIHQGFSLFTQIRETNDEKSFRRLFELYLNGYWDTHYSFGQPSPQRPKALGKNAVDILLINTVAPLLYAYGIKTGNEIYNDRAMNLLENIKAEQNRIIRYFSQAGIKTDNALDSQALIQLHTAYCIPKKCLYCRIGHKLLSSPINRK